MIRSATVSDGVFGDAADEVDKRAPISVKFEIPVLHRIGYSGSIPEDSREEWISSAAMGPGEHHRREGPRKTMANAVFASTSRKTGTTMSCAR